jgi:hypothetical protein
MGFLDKILASFAGKSHSADEYMDLGEGLLGLASIGKRAARP